MAIKRYMVGVSTAGACSDQATAAVVSSRIPMQKPRYDVGFSLSFTISHEAAVMPPRIRMYGA